MDQRDDISSLKGIGEKTALLFNRVGVFSVRDLISYFPVSYIRYPVRTPASDVTPGDRAAVTMTVAEDPKVAYIKGKTILSFTARDDSGSIRIYFFNSLFLKKQIKAGMERVFYGTVGAKGDTMTMAHPRMYDPEEYKRLEDAMMPVYPLTKGLSEKTVTKAVKQALDVAGDMEDPIPESELKDMGLMPLSDSLKEMHFPKDEKSFLRARDRVVFEEFCYFMKAVRKQKEKEGTKGNGYPMIEVAEASRLMESLPYELTVSQKKAYEDIINDMASPHSMNRLVEGDVGSGKTIVALLAMVTAVKNGHQAALMAPTEVLASQHMKKISELLKPYDIKCVLLTGSLGAKQKKEARAMAADGSARIIIGTHALITDQVEYEDLALVITDEQHRFGVMQRKTLSDKSEDRRPHVLVMSATPIPRTLAIMLYGDLDISQMREKPAKRLPIRNAVVDPGYRKKAYNFIKKEVASGHQAYVICPLVEESEGLSDAGVELCNVTEYSEKLSEEWGSAVRVGMLHGRMKSTEKNEIMNRFAAGDIDVLVSTTVVEVGVDVPSATVMMIENAERFGLSELHQLRGRIGRGDAQSYCIFVNTSKSGAASERLEILKNSNDGFEIATEDLRLRGPGAILGVRQSGAQGFRVADIYRDAKILKMASAYVGRLDSRSLSTADMMVL